MVTYCRLLNSPFLVLETPASYILDKKKHKCGEGFFSSSDLNGVRLVWEIRAPVTQQAVDLMQDFDIIHCVDISRSNQPQWSDVGYTRLFGKGKHNIYQFTDEELHGNRQKCLRKQGKDCCVVLSWRKNEHRRVKV